MAGVVSGKSGNKLNVELNLVPFIDLLSSLVLFLLITAVWLQISAIPAAVESSGKSATPSSPPERLAIRVTPGGYHLTWPKSHAGPDLIAKAQGDYDLATLASVLAPVAKA